MVRFKLDQVPQHVLDILEEAFKGSKDFDLELRILRTAGDVQVDRKLWLPDATSGALAHWSGVYLQEPNDTLANISGKSP